MWDTSGSILTAIPSWNRTYGQVPPSVVHDFDSFEKQAEDPDWIVLGAAQQPNSLEPESANFFDPVPPNSPEWKLTVELKQREILVKRDEQLLVIGRIETDFLRPGCWKAYRNSSGDQVLVVGDADGKLHWFAVEV